MSALRKGWPFTCGFMGNRRGHSLVELVIVIGIIALVMAIIVATFAKVYRVIESWN